MPLLRIVGQAPLAAKVYQLERLRCNGCGQMFTAKQPAEAGPDKYGETTAPMKCGSGLLFNRLESLHQSVGIPLPGGHAVAAVEEFAEPAKPAWNELIRQGDARRIAAQ